MKLQFPSGSPRTGPTLLTARLGPNSWFEARISGLAAGLEGNLPGETSGRNEFSAFIGDDVHQRVSRAGTPGLHVVRPQVGARTRETVLPPDVFRRFENDAFWRDPALNRHGVRII